jgi:hypothetical protein
MEVSEHQPIINDVLHADTQSSLSRTLQQDCTDGDRFVCARNKVYVCVHNSAPPQDKYKTMCIHEGRPLSNFLYCGICCDPTQQECCEETADCEPSPDPNFEAFCIMNQCELEPKAVEGRPFRDAEGELVTADYRACDEAVWSAISAQSKDLNAKTNTEATDETGLGSEWARRAVGEHASIASFAAFTIALMSNGAPPDLIRDSLLAALDELGHAKTAFQMASLLTGQHMEPGVLAPSNHSFDGDITALAMGAASEGCIAETLSALVLAAEVDNAARLDGVYSLLADKTRTIALEEGKHSSLAWRTIRWVCSIDEAVCDAVKTQVLNSPNLIGAGGIRLASAADDDVGKAWTRIHEALLPFATSGQASTTLDCAVGSVGEENEATSLTSLLVHNIIHGVQCEDGYVRSSVN